MREVPTSLRSRRSTRTRATHAPSAQLPPRVTDFAHALRSESLASGLIERLARRLGSHYMISQVKIWYFERVFAYERWSLMRDGRIGRIRQVRLYLE